MQYSEITLPSVIRLSRDTIPLEANPRGVLLATFAALELQIEELNHQSSFGTNGECPQNRPARHENPDAIRWLTITHRTIYPYTYMFCQPPYLRCCVLYFISYACDLDESINGTEAVPAFDRLQKPIANPAHEIF